MRLRLAGLAVSAGLLALGATSAFTPAATQTHAATHSAAGIAPAVRHLGSKHWQSPPTTADCVATAGIPCYAPFQLQQAYDLNSLYARGLTGRGRTIVIVDSFGSPTVRADLAKFDADFGLPAPPRFNIIQPAARCHRSTLPTRPWPDGARRQASTSSGRTASRRAPTCCSSRRRWPRLRVFRASQKL